jgi:hypothetical protein
LTGGSVDLGQIGQWMVYGFIACTALHVILVYAHHAAGPELAQQISTGISRGQIRDRAIHDAEKQLEVETAALARDITADIVASVRRDLQLPIPADPRMPFLPAENYRPVPVVVPPAEKSYGFLTNPGGWLKSRFGGKSKETRTYEQTATDIGLRIQLSADDRQGWVDTKIGTRTRMWCLDCRDQGDVAGFTSPAPCEHVLLAASVRSVSMDERAPMLDQFIREANKQEDAKSAPDAPFPYDI